MASATTSAPRHGANRTDTLPLWGRALGALLATAAIIVLALEYGVLVAAAVAIVVSVAVLRSDSPTSGGSRRARRTAA
jgi:hypothetical protein